MQDILLFSRVRTLVIDKNFILEKPTLTIKQVLIHLGLSRRQIDYRPLRISLNSLLSKFVPTSSNNLSEVNQST